MPRLFILALCALSMIVQGVGAQAPEPAHGTGVADLESRLRALRPGDPLAYFELGEEVASEIRTEEGVALARRLFVLAYELDREGAGAGQLSASACLALADIETDGARRAFVVALARSIAPRSVAGTLVADSGPPPVIDDASRDDALALATALAEYRAGNFAEALAILESPGPARLLERYGSLVGGSSRIVRQVQSRPSCPECKNRRVVRDTINPDANYRLCYTCGGDPSPTMTPLELLSLLRLESILVGGPATSWGAQIASGADEAFLDIDPAALARVFEIDPSRTVWREGGWMAPGSAPPVRVDPEAASK